MTQDSKHAFWSQQIQAWEHSQIGQQEFCRQHTLSYPQFCYWRKRLKLHAPTSDRKFIPVVLNNNNASVCISLPPGIRLEVPAERVNLIWTVISKLTSISHSQRLPALGS